MTLDNRIPQIIERVDLVDLVSRYGGAQAGSGARWHGDLPLPESFARGHQSVLHGERRQRDVEVLESV